MIARGWRARLLHRLPPSVARPAFRLAQRLQTLGVRPGEADDGLPLPPPFLRVLTAGTASAEHFLAVGRAAAAEVLRLAQAQDPSATAGPILEFGVGCGRVARHVVRQRPDAAFYGCDVDPRLLSWSRANLPGDYALTRHDPPLPYADSTFGLVYALSVFTHLHEASLVAWLTELARVTRPSGVAVLSFHDERLPQGAPVRAALSEKGFAVLTEGDPGSNLLSVYLTAEGFAARAGPLWRLAAVTPSDGSATGQAWAVLRRQAA